MKKSRENIIEIITIEQNKLWDDIVKTFRDYDVYYLSSYARCFQSHGDGEPILVHYNTNALRGICVYMKREISDEYCDIITPYGYGGFLFEGICNKENMEQFQAAFFLLMQNNKIVSEFVRYAPYLKNADTIKTITNVIDLGYSVLIDLETEALIWENLDSKCRNMIRKAQKMGVIIKHSKDKQLFSEFSSIYNETMNRDNATSYYYFRKEFYDLLSEGLYDNYEVFYAEKDGKIIAMSIILYANDKMHYHLSGSNPEYRNLAPTNLLLYEAARWGCENGFKLFHLGGGLGSKKDNLYKFKTSFNKKSEEVFSISKQIFNQEIYNKLVELRAASDGNFDKDSSFFPLYRA